MAAAMLDILGAVRVVLGVSVCSVGFCSDILLLVYSSVFGAQESRVFGEVLCNLGADTNNLKRGGRS